MYRLEETEIPRFREKNVVKYMVSDHRILEHSLKLDFKDNFLKLLYLQVRKLKI